MRRGKASNFEDNLPSREGKKTLPKPLTVSGFFVVVILYLCKRVLFVKPEVKVCVYLLVCLMGSVISDIFYMPRTYFSRVDNIFNQYFVKLCWGWTCSLLCSFVYMTSYVYTCGNLQYVKLHLSRLGIGTAVWYIMTTSFVVICGWTGFCTSDLYFTRGSCIMNGHSWIGFDISGHTFMMVYCTLMLGEESKCFHQWERIRTFLDDTTEEDVDERLKHLSRNQISELRTSYNNLTSYIKINFLLMALLSILWDVMLLSTILYFHTLAQKMIAIILSIVCWFMTYRVWYLADLSPGLPGQGPFRYSLETTISRTSRRR